MGKLVWVFAGLFGGIGFAMLGVAAVTGLSTLRFQSEAQSAPGKVVGLDGGKPVVEFAAPGGVTQRITGSVSSNPPAYHVGEDVRVRYRAGQPADARIDGFLESWFLPALFGFLGSVFTGVGAVFGITEIRKRRLRVWLLQFGVKIQARYTGVMLDTGVRINRRHPWRLTAQWQNPATGLVHSFESDMLFWDPSDFVQRDSVDVWIDPNNPRRHHVDTAFLPKHAEA